MSKKATVCLIVLIMILAAAPLVLRAGSEFGGADMQAEAVVKQIDPGYTSWAKPLIQLPSGEVESLLFALQAALGAGFIGYYLGKTKSTKNAKKTDTNGLE